MSGRRKNLPDVGGLLQPSSTDGFDSARATTPLDLYGPVGAVDDNRQTAEAISIFEIFPDPAQPRRAIPISVRNEAGWEKAVWDGDQSSIQAIFPVWEELVNKERKRRKVEPNFALDDYLSQHVKSLRDEVDRLEQTADPDDEIASVGSLERTLVDLIELANSIRNDGLANPITVVFRGMDRNQLETGERRWLAFHLLYWYSGDAKYATIPARILNEGNIWRQAAENNARRNLNAISRARQFAMLLMDLRSDTYKSFEQFGSEQQYYAQVEDGNIHRIPKGDAERLLNAMGLKQPKQLREYRALLRLPREVWEWADDLNWPERAIRDLRTQYANDDELIVAAAQKAREEGYEIPNRYSVPTGTVSKETKKKATNTDLQFAPNDKRFFLQMVKTLNQAKQGQSGKREEALSMMEEMRRWLEEEQQRLEHLND